ncbi:MAG: hypothetical protein K8I82_00625 [Anaerolineae bacterium]|nr:hypothetical protein [Anaerolineae bacterium]
MTMTTCDPGTEVFGASIQGFIRSMTAHNYLWMVSKHGYDNLDPNKWYPLQNFLDFMNDIIKLPNLTMNMVTLGMDVAKFTDVPPEMEVITFEQMVEGWNAVYQGNFRNGYAGHKTAIKVADQHYKVVHENTIMPDDLEYGILYGFAKRFLAGTQFTVWYDEDLPRMDQGGDQTVIHVKWK